MSYVGGVRNSATESPHPVGPTLYGTCSTAAATAAKVVSYSDFDALLDGVEIRVKFIYTNTASSPTLNVNDTGEKNIYMDGANVPGTTAATSWYANAIVSFTYDSDSDVWRMNDTFQTALAAEASTRSSADNTLTTAVGNCVKYTSQSLTTANQLQARKNIAAAYAPLKFTSVSASSWTSNGTTYFPYRCAITLSGVTAAMIAEVNFSQTQAESGNYSPYCATYAGGVYIYSSTNSTITIPSIVVHRWDS